MKRAKAARKLVEDGENPLDMLLAAVWPDHDWSESALLCASHELHALPRCRRRL
jgi:hypothetical protein